MRDDEAGTSIEFLKELCVFLSLQKNMSASNYYRDLDVG
jgi:hypothetical protein